MLPSYAISLTQRGFDNNFKENDVSLPSTEPPTQTFFWLVTQSFPRTRDEPQRTYRVECYRARGQKSSLIKYESWRRYGTLESAGEHPWFQTEVRISHCISVKSRVPGKPFQTLIDGCKSRFLGSSQITYPVNVSRIPHCISV